MNVSLVLATVGRLEEVDRLLASLIAQTDRRFELIVVDQNPDDRLCPLVERARLAGLDTNHLRFARRNLSAARNAGVNVARHEIVAFPDDDCWYDPDVIRRVVNYLSHSSSLRGVVARWAELEPRPRHPYELKLSSWRAFRAPPASSITLFMRKSLVMDCGGFDERIGVSCWYGGGEEIDLVIRCLSINAVIHHAPDVVVHHRWSPPGTSENAGDCMKSRRRARGTGALYAKHQLPLYVILRGIFSPFVKALLPPYRLHRSVSLLCMSLGRIEGSLKWRLTRQNRFCYDWTRPNSSRQE